MRTRPASARPFSALLVAPLVAALLAAVPQGVARAQDTPVGVRPYRFTVEGFLAQSYLNDELVGGDKNTFGGYGVRVLFNRSTPANALRTVADRASVGGFLSASSGQGALDVATLHYGVQADVSILPRAAFRGTLDPFVSLGVGAFRTTFGPRSGSGDIKNTDLAVTPAIGTRLSLLQGFGLRGDLRAPIVFGNSTTVNAVAEGGVFISF
jgi:hypothetical protein